MSFLRTPAPSGLLPPLARLDDPRFPARQLRKEGPRAARSPKDEGRFANPSPHPRVWEGPDPPRRGLQDGKPSSKERFGKKRGGVVLSSLRSQPPAYLTGRPPRGPPQAWAPESSHASTRSKPKPPPVLEAVWGHPPGRAHAACGSNRGCEPRSLDQMFRANAKKTFPSCPSTGNSPWDAREGGGGRRTSGEGKPFRRTEEKTTWPEAVWTPSFTTKI